MGLEFVLLEILDKKSLTGYDLKKYFDHKIQHIWKADQNHIYRALSKLNKDGLVTQEIVEQDERPNRKVYHITSEGRNALAEWLRSATRYSSMRNEPMAQMFFSGQLSDEELLEIIAGRVGQMRLALKKLEKAIETENTSGEEPLSERDHYILLLTLEIRKRDLLTRLEFSEEVLLRLDRGEFPKG